MKALITTDLHLTSNLDDFYRFGIFKRLKQLKDKTGADYLYILGDLTDTKDNHPAKLVNAICKEFYNLLEYFDSIIIVKGNHDYIDPYCPFFGFMNTMGIMFLISNFMENDAGIKSMFVPHTRDLRDLKKEIRGAGKLNYVFTHLTFSGARASNNYELEGVSGKWFENVVKVFSGDIHVPQNIGNNIIYVGCPYHVRYGDEYAPRIICLDLETGIYKSYPQDDYFPRKYSIQLRDINQLKTYGIRKGDYLKITYLINHIDSGSINDLKNSLIKEIEENIGAINKGIIFKSKINRVRLIKEGNRPETDLLNVDDTELVKKFARKEKINNEILDYGVGLL